MKKALTYFFFLSFLVFAASCGNDSFTLEGSLEDAGTQNLRFVYASDGSIHSQWIPSVKGEFRMEGKAKDLTVVYVYSSQMKFITHVAVKNGDKIAIKGKIADNYDISATGSKINEEWLGFIRQNSVNFKKADTEKTDSAITAFIKNNQENIVSTLLLTCDYTDIESETAKTLLESINEKAKPTQLLTLYGKSLMNETYKQKKISVLGLRDDRDSMALVDLKKKPLTLLYFWQQENEGRDSIVRKLKNVKQRESNVQIIDICMGQDTLNWRVTIKKDSTNWKHYKAICGPVDKTISDLNVTGKNFFIVADTTGTQLYRGASINEAQAAIDKKQKN